MSIHVSRDVLCQARRVVVKIGSAQLTTLHGGLDKVAIARWALELGELHRSGRELLIVSSGAVSAGMAKLSLERRPEQLSELQAVAAVGQMGLVQQWERSAQERGFQTAQVLLTHDDLSDRRRYLNARTTLKTLLNFRVVPVINENDTVVTDEICFGDNDTLAALVANLVEADVLIILTDQHGLFESDPRDNSDAKLIGTARAVDPTLKTVASAKAGTLGRGGMATKVRAAAIASRSGSHTVIAHGASSDVLTRILAGDDVGTFLYASQTPQAARKQWLSAHLQMRGTVNVDAGAERVLIHEGKSLLPVGVLSVEGDFKRGEIVAVLNASGNQIARGLVNYSAIDARQLIRCPSSEIFKRLGYVNEPELIHRDNMVVELE